MRVLGKVSKGTYLGEDKRLVQSCVTDALLGLRELLEANPQLIDPSLTTLINACVRIIGDEVRQSGLILWYAYRCLYVKGRKCSQNSPVILILATSSYTNRTYLIHHESWSMETPAPL
jgi:hypothetical protein